MKLVAKLFATVAVALSFAVHAANPAPRREAVLDTGKGGMHLVVSVPSFGQGPYDFAKNPGPKNNKFPAGAYSEVMFNAPVGETGVVVYQVNAVNRFKSNKGDQALTPDVLAADMLKQNGFTLDRATKIDSPDVGMASQTKGFVISVEIVEKNVVTFDTDPAAVEKLAKKAFIDVFKNYTLNLN